MARAALKKRGSLLIWLDKEMTWLAPYEGRPGRPAVFSDAAIHLSGIRKQSGGLFSRRMA